ncbi:MAG: hypothetical protein AAGE94_19335, partial [Acidobacteriota bacterium]
QVFYNTTRKLVLKGVDGVVFVADSQRPMVQANIDSFKNLEENLSEMGLSLDTIPLVLQYNKRDLPNICTVEELNQALNTNGWPAVESSALTGMGVFETLKTISKMTLLALKRRLAKGGRDSGRGTGSRAAARPGGASGVRTGPMSSRSSTGSGPRPATTASGPRPAQNATVKPAPADTPKPEPPKVEAAPPEPAKLAEPATPEPVKPPEPGAPQPAKPPEPGAPQPEAAKPEPAAPAITTPAPEPDPVEPPVTAEPKPSPAPAAKVETRAEPARPEPAKSEPAAEASPSPAKPAPAKPSSTDALLGDISAAVTEPKRTKTGKKAKSSRGGGIDALAELEKLRQQALHPKRASAKASPAEANGRDEIKRDVQVTLSRDDFSRARRFTLTLQVEDADRRIVDSARHLHVDLDDPGQLERLMLRLNIALNADS